MKTAVFILFQENNTIFKAKASINFDSVQHQVANYLFALQTALTMPFRFVLGPLETQAPLPARVQDPDGRRAPVQLHRHGPAGDVRSAAGFQNKVT